MQIKTIRWVDAAGHFKGDFRAVKVVAHDFERGAACWRVQGSRSRFIEQHGADLLVNIRYAPTIALLDQVADQYRALSFNS
jgi:hypothetical protein